MPVYKHLTLTIDEVVRQSPTVFVVKAHDADGKKYEFSMPFAPDRREEKQHDSDADGTHAEATATVNRALSETMEEALLLVARYQPCWLSGPQARALARRGLIVRAGRDGRRFELTDAGRAKVAAIEAEDARLRATPIKDIKK